MLPALAVSVTLGRRFATRRRCGRWPNAIGLGRPHVGALLDQCGRQTDRHLARQLERRNGECLDQFLARETADQRDQQVPLLDQLPLQRRQCLLDLGKRRLLRHHVGFSDLPKPLLAAQEVEQVPHNLDDLFGRRDLAA